MHFNSAGMIFSNVPWLGAYVRCIPPLVAPLNTLHDRCRNLATQRIMRGSETRDLFYYLVGTFLLVSTYCAYISSNHCARAAWVIFA